MYFILHICKYITFYPLKKLTGLVPAALVFINSKELKTNGQPVLIRFYTITHECEGKLWRQNIIPKKEESLRQMD